jgi:transcriptional regulator with XRE-family HTH domain
MYKKVRDVRHEKGITISDIAEHLGMSRCNYSKKELGLIRFSLEEAQKVSDFFGTNIETLFFDTKCSIIEH